MVGGSASEGVVRGVDSNYGFLGFVFCLLKFGFSSTADRVRWSQERRHELCGLRCQVFSSLLCHQGQGSCPALLELLSAGHIALSPRRCRAPSRTSDGLVSDSQRVDCGEGVFFTSSWGKGKKKTKRKKGGRSPGHWAHI